MTGRSHDTGSIARVSALEIEALVVKAVTEHLAKLEPPRCGMGAAAEEGVRVDEGLASNLGSRHSIDAPIVGAIESVTVAAQKIEIALSDAADAEDHQHRRIVVPWSPRSQHRRRDIVQATDEDPRWPRRAMRVRARDVFIEAFSDAHRWLDELLSDANASLGTLAARERRSERSIRMTLSLAFLAPGLVKAAIDGRLPRGFNRTRLVDPPRLWSEQWRALGLEPPLA